MTRIFISPGRISLGAFSPYVLGILTCLSLTGIQASTVCDTTYYLDAGSFRKNCSNECADIINGGDLNSPFNYNCKTLCKACYDYIVSIRRSITSTTSRPTTRASNASPITPKYKVLFHRIVTTQGTSLTQSAEKPSFWGVSEILAITFGVVAGIFFTISIVACTALICYWKKGKVMICGQEERVRANQEHLPNPKPNPKPNPQPRDVDGVEPGPQTPLIPENAPAAGESEQQTPHPAAPGASSQPTEEPIISMVDVDVDLHPDPTPARPSEDHGAHYTFQGVKTTIGLSNEEETIPKVLDI